MFKVKTLSTFFLLTFLSSCFVLPPMNQSPVGDLPTPTMKTVIGKTSITSTMLPTEYVPAPEPTSTVQISKNESYKEECLTTNSFAEIPKGQGFIVLAKEGSEHSSIIDIQTAVTLSLPDQWQGWDWKPSPNQDKLLHLPSKKILDFDGTVLANINVDQGWYIRGWLDNDYLLLGEETTDTGSQEFRTVVINPVKGVRQEPNIDSQDIFYFFDQINYFPIILNPMLNRVAYPSVRDDGSGYVVRDIEQKKDVAFLPAPVTKEAKWSLDGKEVAIIGEAALEQKGFELYGIDMGGRLEKLTTLTRYFDYIGINNFSWSSNGRFIAFWLTTTPSNGKKERLAILDVDEKIVIDYCIAGLGIHSTEPPIWSPDSQQLVVQSRDEENNDFAVLVDLKQGAAFVLGMNLKPMFWMNRIPEIWKQGQ